MPTKLTPLQFDVPLINVGQYETDGTPTPYFIQFLQQLLDEKAVTDEAVDLSLLNVDPERVIGRLPPDAGEAQQLTLSQILDFAAGADQGHLLHRNATEWESLPPGDADQVLTAHGAGADLTWEDAAAGGAGVEAYYNTDNVSAVVNPTPVPITAKISVAIPASSVARTFFVGGNINWRTGAHGMRGSVMVDGVAVWPGFNGMDPISTGDGNDTLKFACVVTIPGDNAGHTIALGWASQAATTAITFENAHIAAIRLSAGDPPVGVAANDWLDLSFTTAATVKWGGGNWFASDEQINLTGIDKIEIVLQCDRDVTEYMGLAISPDADNCYMAIIQNDNNYVLYSYDTSGGGSTVLSGGVVSQAESGNHELRLLVHVAKSGTNDRVISVANTIDRKGVRTGNTNLRVATNKIYIRLPNDTLANKIQCKYRKNAPGGV